jgi:two-component system, chemotaxis family, protein-glutamate methylesterase/glutaminase
MPDLDRKYEGIVIGTSAGGFHALTIILQDIPPDYALPIIVVQHRAKNSYELLEHVLQIKCRIRIQQAEEKEKVRGSTVYVAPPDYHLLIESDRTLSLSSDEPVRFSRPSIDVLFESAATAFGDKLIGIILSGANDDGARGITAIGKKGGLTIAQDPQEAAYPAMVQAAIRTKWVNHIWPLSNIRNFLLNIDKSA